jgi:tetratricopeptide (TPR) repeat protein
VSSSLANSVARLLLAVAASWPLAAAPAWAQWADGPSPRHARCIAEVQENPKQGLERAQLWRIEGGGWAADHCIAMAYYGLKDFHRAAERFEQLAAEMTDAPAMQRAGTLDQAGQSWLAADEPARAKPDFDAALALQGNDPDLFIDRAEALAAQHQYQPAIGDLDRAIALAPNRADAYIYRGSAYRSLSKLDRALDDVEHGLKLQPSSVLGLLERGNIRRLEGDTAGARQDWRRVAELAPDSAAAAAAKVNLDRLNAPEGKP